MAAYHDQVTILLGGQVMDLLARLPIFQMRVATRDARVLGEQPIQARLGLVELLLLQLRQIHRYIAAKGHGHGFDDVDQGDLGAGRLGEGHRALDHRIAFFGQVDRDQQVGVGHGRCSWQVQRFQ